MNNNTCDILIHNGQVITMDPERRIYRSGAVAVTGSRIVEVGADVHPKIVRAFKSPLSLEGEGVRLVYLPLSHRKQLRSDTFEIVSDCTREART